MCPNVKINPDHCKKGNDFLLILISDFVSKRRECMFII